MADDDRSHPPGEWRPAQDPTPLETAQRELALLERRLLDRFEAVEKSQGKFEDSITRVPTDVDKQVGQLRSELEATINANAKLQEAKLEATVNLLEAKIGANAKLAEAMAKASDAAIAKTETSVEERLKQMSELYRSEIGSVRTNLQTTAQRLGEFESRHAGSASARADVQSTQGHWVGIGMAVLGVGVVFASVIVTLTGSASNQQPTRIIERQSGPSTVIDRPNQVVVPEGSG